MVSRNQGMLIRSVASGRNRTAGDARPLNIDSTSSQSKIASTVWSSFTEKLQILKSLNP